MGRSQVRLTDYRPKPKRNVRRKCPSCNGRRTGPSEERISARGMAFWHDPPCRTCAGTGFVV